MSFLDAQGIVKTYSVGGTRLTVLRDLDVHVSAGEMVAIVGASGVGKSTLLHVLGGLDRADEGTVSVNGTTVTSLPDADLVAFRNRHVGFVFQFHHLLPEFSALENVAIPIWAAGRPRAEGLERGRALLARVGLSERFGHRPAELSGGEQQRVAICRALANRPAVLLADEPTGNLDPETAGRVFDMLLELADAGLRGAAAARAFESERLGDDADGQDSLVARGLGDDWRRAGSGAATHAGGDEAHVRAFERALDLIQRFFRGSPANLRPRAGAEPLRDLQAKLDSPVGRRGVQRLGVGVGDEEIDPLDVAADHVGDGVAARAADTNDANPRSKLVDLRTDEIDAHGFQPSPCT